MRWLLLACLVGTAAADPARVELTWVVHPLNGKDEKAKSPVDLEIKIAGATKTLALPPQFGGLTPHNQIVCKTTAYPLEKGEVAKITFYEGGAGGLFVRRTKTGYEIVDWSLTDGACPDAKGEPTVCPRHEKFLRKVDLPADAKFVEAIVEVDAAGKRHALSCK